ncbi:MAG: hypothetical protein D6798_05385 [Deltaproteobacteria bacterium]|nr:MAG: hypothetical protein D6798_05385 [Deltaproteobacteria bacterium]
MLALIQQQLQALYRTEAPDVRRFLVDDDALRTLIGDDARPADEWVLVHQDGDDVDLAVYVDEGHLQRLATARSPGEAARCCFRALCAAVEGVSHFLLLAHRARQGQPVRMLELEAQAEVDKYLVARLHHPDDAREWRTRLFRDATLAEGLSPAERERYTEAARLAEAWVDHLERLPHIQAVLDRQREFWRRSGCRRLEEMRRLAA